MFSTCLLGFPVGALVFLTIKKTHKLGQFSSQCPWPRQRAEVSLLFVSGFSADNHFRFIVLLSIIECDNHELSSLLRDDYWDQTNLISIRGTRMHSGRSLRGQDTSLQLIGNRVIQQANVGLFCSLNMCVLYLWKKVATWKFMNSTVGKGWPGLLRLAYPDILTLTPNNEGIKYKLVRGKWGGLSIPIVKFVT